MDDPVDFRDVETSGRDVGTEENTGRSIAKLEESVGTFLLLLLPLQVCQRNYEERYSFGKLLHDVHSHGGQEPAHRCN